MVSGVYRIRNTVNGKVYIGSSIDVNRRKTCHFSTLRKQTHRNRHLQAAWNKYGESAFIFEVVELCSRELCVEAEQRWLDKGSDYNIARSATAPMLGRTHTDQWKAESSARQRGKPMAEETKRKLSAALKGRRCGTGTTGKKFSAESRAKMSAAQRARFGKN